MKDWPKAFAWPTEGENFLNWIAVRVVNTGKTHARRKSVRATGPYEKEKHPVPSLAAPIEFSWTLEPEKSAEFVVAIPWEPVPRADFSHEDAKLWLDRTIEYWRGVMADAASIQVPCEKATQAYLAAHVCQLIASDHGELHGGEGFYDEFYIRDGAYQVMELEEAGLRMPRGRHQTFTAHQRDDGRFESQKNQFDANGQALWALWQYFKITGDRPWLERVYPQMRKAASGPCRRGGGPRGLAVCRTAAGRAGGRRIPVGRQASHPGLRLLEPARAALHGGCGAALGKKDDAEKFQKEAEEYREAIDTAWKADGLPHFPPSWEKDGTYWGNTETLWPTPIFATDDSARRGAHEGGAGKLSGRIRGRHHPLDGREDGRRHPPLHVRLHDDGIARARRGREGGRGVLLVPAAFDGHARVSRRHVLQAPLCVEQHDSARDRGLELCAAAPAHAGPRAG